MNIKATKFLLPAAIAAGTLGFGTVATMPAGASTKTVHAKAAAATFTGTVVKDNATKSVFWLKDGTKTYIVHFKKATFSAGTAASLVKGTSVSVTGRLAGKKKVVIVASTVKA